MKKLTPFARYLLIAAAVVAMDQAVKLIVKVNMPLGSEIVVLGDFFKILFAENDGAAGGLMLHNILPFLSPETSKAILTVFSLVAAVGITWFLRRISLAPTKLPLLVALVLGGAVGNIIDRVFYGVFFADINHYEGGLLHGQVVDMIYFDIWRGEIFGSTWHLWPIFNVADAAISVGIITILVFQKRLFPDPPKPAAAVATETPVSATEGE